MAKKTDVPKGEQMPLMDVGPKNLEKIAPIARRYKALVKERTKILAQEIKLKRQLHELIKKSKLKPLDNGKIKFTCEGLDIEVEYRDEVIHIKEHKEPKRRGRKKKDKSMQKTVAETEDKAPAPKTQAASGTK